MSFYICGRISVRNNVKVNCWIKGYGYLMGVCNFVRYCHIARQFAILTFLCMCVC